MAHPPLLEIQDVSLNHGDKTLLEKISFSILENETLLLLGVSGSGKSLLIEALAENLKTEGNIVRSSSLNRRDLTFSFDTLDAVDAPDLEIYTLQALTQGLNMQYVPRQEIFLHLGVLKYSLAKSLEKDKRNVRAYYVNAQNDFYTPKEYGGGQQAESLLDQALSLDQAQGGGPQPTWGHAESMVLLLRLYLKSDRKDEAAALFKRVKSRYPDSIDVLQIAKEFE